MNDLDKLMQLFHEFGINYKQEEERSAGTVIRIETYTTKVEGYSGFYSEYTFDSEGKFIQVGIWE